MFVPDWVRQYAHSHVTGTMCICCHHLFLDSIDLAITFLRYAKQKGIYLTACGHDEDSIDFLVDELRIPFLGITSSELTNLPLLKHGAKKEVPLVLSTGLYFCFPILVRLQQFNVQKRLHFLYIM